MNEDGSGIDFKSWSTDVVDSRERLDYWVGAVCEAFLEMDCSSREASSFGGQLTSVIAKELAFNQVVASTQDVFRTASAIARGDHYPFYLITESKSAWHVRKDGHVLHFRPGDVALVDSAQRYELHFPEAFALMSIQLPRAWVGRWLRSVDSPLPRKVDRDRGWGQTLSALCMQLARDPSTVAHFEQHMLSDHLGAMLGAALEPAQPSSRSPVTHGIVERTLKHLRERIEQRGLTAEAVSHALGISVRTLHRAFAAEHLTFAGTLRHMRLEVARQMLAQPRLAHVTVAEIARRCGFADGSHFVREFHQAFSITPSRWRRGLQAEG